MLAAARLGKGPRLLATAGAAALWLCAAASRVRAEGEPGRAEPPAENLEAVPLDRLGDGGIAALINAVAPPPPPPPTLRCPEPIHCAPDSDLSQIAWIFVGLTTSGMLLTSWWAVAQQKRAGILREELSRIRLHRTSSIRGGRPLAEVQMPPPGLGARPDTAAAPATRSGPGPTTLDAPGPVAQPGPKVPLVSPPPPTSSPLVAAQKEAPLPAGADELAQVRRDADARLAMAQAPLRPLLDVARSVEEWFRSGEFEAVLEGGSAQRGLLDRVWRGLVAASATFHALRDARVFPTTQEAIAEELERYWEQVYESLDDVHRVVNLLATDEGRRALATPGADAVRVRLDQLLDATRDYLASDGRRLIPIEPMRTDFDRRIHHAVDARRAPGVPQGKVLSVVRCGISRDGRVIRKPEVVQSL